MPPLNTFSRSCLALAISQAVLTSANASIIEVNDIGDTGSAGTCTLRQAIVSANTNASGASNCVAGVATDTITFANSIIDGSTISLGSTLPNITSDMTITAQGISGLTIDANNTGRVFKMIGATVSINNLTITGGLANFGAGIYLREISNVSLSNTTVMGNSSTNRGGGIYAIVDSSLSLSNSTVSGNSATNIAGGIYARDDVSVSLINSTVSDNSAAQGGGIFTVSSTVSLSNSIVAGNLATTGAEINNYNGASTFTTSYNLLGDNSHSHAQAFVNFTLDSTDINATSVTDGVSIHLPTGISSILTPLTDNGGPTQTHALVDGSPALDVADGTVCTTSPINSEDQRSLPRNSVCDIGAFEKQTTATITVGSSADGSGSCTLRDAIESSNTDASVGGCVAGNNNELIVFDTGVFPVDGANTITLTGELPIISDVTITGQGASGLIIDANNTGRVFNINSATVSLNNLTVTGGSITIVSGGAGIKAQSSIVNINNSTISGNSNVNWGGGGIYALTGSSISLINTTVSDNLAQFGGGIAIRSGSSLSLINSTVSTNVVTSNSLRGGGIYLNESNASLVNSTVSGNSAANDGAGISLLNVSVSIINSTLLNNSAGGKGGGILAKFTSSVSISNSIVAGNLAATTAAEIYVDGTSTFTTDHNLLGDSSKNNSDAFAGFTPDITTDITATSDSTQGAPTALPSILEPLADNDGATQTHALVVDSPAIDAGDNVICAAEPINNLDQRGEKRPMGSACDIGSYEAEASSFFVVPLANGKVVIFSL